MTEDMSTIEQISEQLDTVLLKQLKDGVDVVSKSGEKITIDTPAAVLNVARQRLKDCDMVEATIPGSKVKEIMEFMPKVDLGADAATG